MTKQQLIDFTQSNIKNNTGNEITGQIMQDTLMNIIEYIPDLSSQRILLNPISGNDSNDGRNNPVKTINAAINKCNTTFNNTPNYILFQNVSGVSHLNLTETTPPLPINISFKTIYLDFSLMNIINEEGMLFTLNAKDMSAIGNRCLRMHNSELRFGVFESILPPYPSKLNFVTRDTNQIYNSTISILGDFTADGLELIDSELIVSGKLAFTDTGSVSRKFVNSTIKCGSLDWYGSNTIGGGGKSLTRVNTPIFVNNTLI